MDYGYIVKISNNKIYREIQLQNDIKTLRIGLGTECDVRFYKELFFEKFCLTLTNKNNAWQITCSDNVYIDAGDVRKLVTKNLVHGDIFKVKYQSGETELFKVEFLIDFDNADKKYERVIDISNLDCVTIGSNPSSNIILNSPYTVNDRLELRKNGADYMLRIISSACGAYHNGAKAANNEKIKNGDFFSVAQFSFYIKNGRLMTDTNVLVNGLACYDEQPKNDYPKFNRNTRVKFVVDDEKIQILDPPAKPQKPKNNLLSRLLPSLVMIVAGMAMAAFSTFMLISSGIGVITAIISLIQSKKDFKTNSQERIEKYNKYIENKKVEIEKDRSEEKEVLEHIYNDQEELMNRFFGFSGDLFDRSLDDEDFLCVRLGTGDVKAKKEIDYKKQEKLEIEDDLQTIPENLSKEYEYIHSAPIVCNFKESGAIGIIGREQFRFELMKTIIIDLCARQFPADVSLFFVCEEQHRNKIHWLRMLPHVYNDELGIRNIVVDNDSKNILFEYLYKELTAREQSKKHEKHIIVFLFDEFGFKNHPISKFTENAKDIGVTFVYFGDKKSDIGQNCSYLIDINDDHTATLINTADANDTSLFNYVSVEDNRAAAVVDLLAPVYTEEISLEGTLVKNISLFKLLNIIAVDDIDLSANWSNSQVFKSMSAPIGVSKSGVVCLDLHDKAHGPHGLVAGTTGSGKSEILQTYVLSMALLFHPYEVSFVIIDFKGGGMVNQFKDLPHLVGAITNIDGKEIDRSLKSIKAELKKRQRLFAEAEVNHIDKYIKKYKVGEVSEPLPHLILIVDEFAELKAEQPEFMKELISAARIGRSLGVHLILATQKPSGQVDDQIWSNSRFKLCLKVQDQQDSNEVLKSPLAAEIKEPGRAYLQVGNNEIFELFQSAYSGAPELEDTMSIKEFSVNSLNDFGKRTLVFVQKKKKTDQNNSTQLEAIVRYVHEYCETNKIIKLPDICLSPLKENIPYNTNYYYNGLISLGIYDDPDAQYQGEALKNIEDSNMMVIGASQTGKTNLLQLIIRELATFKTPKEVNFYIMDFGSMILKNFDMLNHVGGVIVSSEEEKLKNLIKLLMNEINTRKEKLLSVGVSSFSAYLEAGFSDFPHIYVMLDNFPVFRELYSEKYEDDLLYLIREGVTYGITFVITSPSTSGLGYKYMSNFSEYIALTCNDSGEYSNLFDRCRMEPKNTPGRILFSIDKRIYEAQTYLAFEGEKEIDRINAIRNFIQKCNTKFTDKAKRIPEVPEELTDTYIRNNYDINVKETIAVALSYQTVEPVFISIFNMPQLSVVGKNLKAMNAFVYAVLNDIKNNYFDRSCEVYILDSFKREFKNYKDEAYVNTYDVDYTTLDYIFESINEELEKRYEMVIESGFESLYEKPYILVIINNIDAVDYISKSKKLMEKYNLYITKYKSMKFTFLLTGIEDANFGYSSPELYKKIKEMKNSFIFSNLSEHKVFDIPMGFIRQNKKPLDITQGYYLHESEIQKIKFVKEG